jgi:hypothetical protein
MRDGLPVAVFGNVGSTVNLYDLLKEAYGDQVSQITNVEIGYYADGFFTQEYDAKADKFVPREGGAFGY